MITLNLISPEKTNINYKIQHFPDGQKDIVLTGCLLFGRKRTLSDAKESICVIKSRMNNMEDLGLIICATKALRNIGVRKIHLYTPWIMGLRSDRLFLEGGVRYIKDVIAPILNSLEFESVTCYDPHSYVAENCINNLKTVDNFALARFAIEDMRFNFGEISKKAVLVAPDAGAMHKIYKLAEKINYKGDVVSCSKSRDIYGELSKVNVPLGMMDIEKDVIVIDDICDGGATFINIAKELQKHEGFEGKTYLIVTHGIFSKGLKELSKYFDCIYTTNSIMDINSMTDWGRHNERYLHKIKQLDVF